MIEKVVEQVDRYWATDVEIIGAWHDGATAGYLVYRRLIEPTVVLGRRLEFNAEAAGGTLDSYAIDVAADLDEPIGSAVVRADRYGINWTAIPSDSPTPIPPPDIAARITSAAR